MSYFERFENIHEPVKSDLIDFLEQSRKFLNDVIRNDLDGFGPINDLGLFDEKMRRHAGTLLEDLNRDFKRVKEALNQLSNDSRVLQAHGLIGPPQAFKLNAIAHIEANIYAFGMKKWIKKILEQIDNILESAFDALGAESTSLDIDDSYRLAFIDIGIGTIIKEIKKTIEILLD